jgi:signal peptidase II
MHHRLRSLLIILVVVALDILSKIYIRTHVSGLDMIPIIPGFFNIVHAENAGAAFSMLAEAPAIVRALVLRGISIIVMVIIGVMLWRAEQPKGETRLMRIGLAIVFGGALGNFIDRAFRGTVTDFVQLFFGTYEFPSFNVADSAINIGAAILIWEMWKNRNAKEIKNENQPIH